MSDPHELSARSGDRRLTFMTGGADEGTVLVFHSGTPFPPVSWGTFDEAVAAAGLRLVSYARPGYSGSTRHHGRSVADAAADTATLLDELGVGEFVTLGWSGGGPHALACAALLPERCRAAVTLGGVAPFEAEGLDWMDGMADENVEEFSAVLEGEATLGPYLEKEMEEFSAVTADEVVASLAGLVPDVDREAITGDLAEMMAGSMRRAAAEGLAGWIDDDVAFVRPWGFDLGDVDTPVAIWQGRQDRMVPYAHGEWLSSRIPTAVPRLFEDEGHISLMTARMHDIIGDLTTLAGGFSD
jgi:pimeloyl-ACP methyl ester carboxylesterase